MKRTGWYTFLIALIGWLLIGCASTKPAAISVFNPTFERVRDRIDPVIVETTVPASKARTAAGVALTLLSIPHELKKDSEGEYLRINETPIAGKDKEFGEFFDYEKKAEHAAQWNFDPAALASGRKENLSKYIRTPESGVSGLIRGAMQGAQREINNAYFEGEVRIQAVGRVRSNLEIKIVFYDADFKGKAYRSQGKLEEEIGKLCTQIMDNRGAVLPAPVTVVQRLVKKWMTIQKLTVDEETEERIVSSRNFTEIGWEGPSTIDRFADIPVSLMGIWYGTYRAVFSFIPERDGAAARLVPQFGYYGINMNNGRRRWIILESKGILEEDCLSYVRRAVNELRKKK